MQNEKNTQYKSKIVMLSVVLLASFMISGWGNAAAVNQVYVVQAGDSLWKIASQFNTTVAQLKNENGLSSNLIHPGQKLKIPSRTKRSDTQTYIVKKGDSLWRIANQFGMSVAELKSLNGLTHNLIHPGQSLNVKGAKGLQQSEQADSKATVSYTQEDYEWLAKIIEAEAEGEPYLGKVAVGSVVMNRVEHRWFPDTIKGVIFQQLNGRYQFSPVASGKIYRVKPSQESYKAAREALNGKDPTGGGIYFYNPKIARSKWIFSRKVVRIIGNHHFAI
ncbi:MAG: LysM peptidoglycan-binding domain-containing protein [Bacillaceae bacterium]|nr:LysM peptidoglycan-binding domain-containing protein [Bacillaceae bacterium]